MNSVLKLWLIAVTVLVTLYAAFFLLTEPSLARNVLQYQDLISDSGPDYQSNHTFNFVINTSVSPNGQFEFTFPFGFEVMATSTFGVRNVELLVNGTPRTASSTASPGVDRVEITTGSPGFIRYTLAPDSGVSVGDELQFRVGNHTTGALPAITSYSTTTGTTTSQADIEPIINSPVTGTHAVEMEVYDGGLVASAGFLIAVVNKVAVPNADTTEEIPPYRFNPAPTSTVGGTTLSVEISLETDEFAWCRYATTPGVAFTSMTNLFSNTGLIFHSTVVGVTPNTLMQFYIRCIDDEGNYNIDDFLIAFQVGEQPTGISNQTGSTSGNGTGSGNSGTGSGSGGGGTTGGSNGETPTTGGSSGSGGAGGGGGGGRGGNDGGTAGGGFESEDAPYRSGDARVVISGYAYPQASVTILVDGQIADTTGAGSNGEYSITLDAIARGAYTFGVYASGPNNTKSSTFSTSFTVTGGRTSFLSNINVAPSIKVSPDPVNPGETLTISGYALPNAEITIENGKQRSIKKTDTTTSNASGFWTLSVNTSSFSKGTYEVRAKSKQTGGAETQFSAYTFYGVGQTADVPLNADLNRDGRINLTDFSILLFWWNSSGGDSDPPADINRDGRVNLTDFSIMLFNWTG
jgi:hypothetical protein